MPDFLVGMIVAFQMYSSLFFSFSCGVGLECSTWLRHSRRGGRGGVATEDSHHYYSSCQQCGTDPYVRDW